MRVPELHRLVLQVSLGVLFGMLAMAAQFVRRNWSVDAERADAAHREAVRALWWGILSGLLVLGWLEGAKSLFGFLSILDGRAGRSFLVALAAAFVMTGIRARIHRGAGGIAFSLAVGISVFVLVRAIPGAGWIVAALGLFLGTKFLAIQVIPRPKQKPASGLPWIENLFSRGGWISSLAQVRWRFWAQAQVASEETVFFGFTHLPIRNVSGHFLIGGAPGTGKTIAFRLLMQSVLPNLRGGRAILFDAKHEQVSVAQGMGVSPLLLNPFDARCAVWDLAQDFKTPNDALQLSKLLLPENPKESEPFWRNSARGLLSDVILAHILAMANGTIPTWTFTDILRALQTRKDIENALSLDSRTEGALRNIGDERTLYGILATLDLVRREFEVLGALWDAPWENPERRFSLTEWTKGTGVMVLGPSTLAEEVINPLNRLILDRVGQLVLDRPEDPGREPSRTWLFLDEFPRLGKMPRIESMMTNGRSKGLVVVLGIQDVSDVRHHYGKEQAATLLGCCTHRMLFQAGSYEHAEWCLQNVGSMEVVQLKRTTGFAVTTGQSSSTTKSISTSADEKTRPLFTADEYRLLGKPGIRTPLRTPPAWLASMVPHVGPLRAWFGVSFFSPIRAVCSVQDSVYEAVISFAWTVEQLWEKAGEDFLPRPDTDQFIVLLEDGPEGTTSEQLPLPLEVEGKAVQEALWNISSRNQEPMNHEN